MVNGVVRDPRGDRGAPVIALEPGPRRIDFGPGGGSMKETGGAAPRQFRQRAGLWSDGKEQRILLV